jgi:hypothetical protein
MKLNLESYLLCLEKAGNRDPLDNLYIVRCQIYIYHIVI